MQDLRQEMRSLKGKLCLSKPQSVSQQPSVRVQRCGECHDNQLAAEHQLGAGHQATWSRQC